MNALATKNISDLLVQNKLATTLHSSDKKLLHVPNFKLKTYVSSYIAPHLWNQLHDI